MPSYNHYFLMEKKDIPAYVQDKLSFFPTDAVLTCSEIENSLSRSFCVSDNKGRRIIVKQAGHPLKVDHNITFTRKSVICSANLG